MLCFIIWSLLEKVFTFVCIPPFHAPLAIFCDNKRWDWIKTFKDKCLISSVLMALHLLIDPTCSYCIRSGLLNSARKLPRLRQEIRSSGFIPPTWSYNQAAEEERERPGGSRRINMLLWRNRGQLQGHLQSGIAFLKAFLKIFFLYIYI